MADEPVLEKNQSGEWVQYLQQMLHHAGYWPYETNGEFDDNVEEAVKQFQSANGLPADGIVGAGTWAALTGGGAQSSTGTGEQASEDPNERQVLINGADIPELMYLLSFDSFEDWGRAIGLDLEWLQSDDDELVS